MSTALMGRCWPLQMPPTAKAVLMSLADQGNDQGVCWPAVGTICDRTCLSTRAVQNAIKWLAANGVLVLNREQGKATTYQINPDAFGKGTPDLFTAPARRSPQQQVHPRSGDGTPPHVVRPTPAAGAGDPRTSCTQNHKEPSVKQKKGFDAAAIELPDWLERGLWQRWVRDRKERKKPVTEEAARLQVAKLDAYRADGYTPKEVIEHSIHGGYQGLFAPTRRPGAAPAPTVPTSSDADRTAEYLANKEREAQLAFTPAAEAARKAAMARVKGAKVTA